MNFIPRDELGPVGSDYLILHHFAVNLSLIVTFMQEHCARSNPTGRNLQAEHSKAMAIIGILLMALPALDIKNG